MPATDLFKARLTAFKERLLDLSARNRMIHSNFQARSRLHFRFIDEVPNQLYDKLTTSKMFFKPLPDPEEVPLDEESSDFKSALEEAMLTDDEYLQSTEGIESDQSDNLNQDAEAALRVLKNKVRNNLGMPQVRDDSFSIDAHARAHGLNPSYDLPFSNEVHGGVNEIHTDDKIQTLMLPDTLRRYIKTTYSKYKSSIRESGVNPLFICFGFLDWKESPTSERRLYSPLLMLQVELDDENRTSSLGVSSTGDAISINYTLNEKLKRDFGITLPEIHLSDDDDENEQLNIEDYLEKVKEEIATPNNWKLRNWASFGIYSAQNMPIYKDIEKLLNENFSSLLEKIINSDFENSTDRGLSDLYDVDSDEISSEVPALINPADASQFSAVVDVLRGKDLVIKGPPGTGKSQTITNMIASLMYKGKSVLFVAQKQAALDVVRNNLVAAGLENYLLEIFSIKGKKKTVMRSFKNLLEANPPSEPRNYFAKVKQNHSIKTQLNKHAQILGTEYGSTGLKIHDVIWSAPKLDFDLPPNLQDTLADIKPKEISEDILNTELKELTFLKEEHARIFKDEPLEGLAVYQITRRFNTIQAQDIQRNLITTSELIDQFYKRFLKLDKKNNTLIKNPDGDYFSDSIKEFYKEGGENSLIWPVIKLLLQDKKLVFDYFINKDKLQSLEEKFDKKQKSIEQSFDLENDLYTKVKIKDAIISLKGSHLFSIFFSKWREAHNIFLDLYKKNTKHSGKEEAELLNEYFNFVKNKPNHQKKIDDLRGKLKKSKNKIHSYEKEFDFNSFDKFDHERCKLIVEDINVFQEDFKSAWLEKPDIIHSYIDLLSNSQIHKDRVKDFLEELELWNSDNLFENFRLINELSISKVSIEELMTWLTIENNANERTLTFFKEFLKSKLNREEIKNVYKYIIRDIQKRDIYAEHEALSVLPSNIIENLREDLARKDEEILDLSRKLVASKAHKNGLDAPEGTRTGRVRDRTDMGLINHVAAVPGTRTTLREMFQRAMGATTSLKPCTLMSPLAVSQTLNLEEIYDVVIIDEASQMKPEFSIPAIARAKQLVVVGDEKQLPPFTGFQARNAEDVNDEDLSDESILDMASAVLYPARQLLYHYRSKHEDLIRFSNAKFYGNNLMIPVTAHTNQSNRGIKHIFLEDGRYKPSSAGGPGGINPIEAKRVVAEILKIMEERPNESIGVVTMNQKQKEFIESEYELAKSRNRHAIRYQSHWQQQDEGLNEFFIKNLENVQGDERDNIVISTLYGPHHNDREQGMFQRFGDINRSAGWRRLNVLFTRAKLQIILVTSMLPSDIREENAQNNRGIRTLKEYIAFAESKILQEGEANTTEIESPFQQWAIEQIEALDGFSCDWEIGQSGYRIDIGVKHEEYPYGYIMAVETDGATYHSTASARDRDYLRQTILEGYGWHFHRIWSTDWISNPQRVKEILHSKLKARLSERLENLEKIREANELRGNDENNLDIEPSAEDDNFFDGIQVYEYPETNVADFMNIDKQAYSTRAYSKELRKGILAIIELEGPISFNLIVERIRKAHGFRRAGQASRSTISSALSSIKEIKKTNYKDTPFYWVKDVNPDEYREGRYPRSGYREIENIAPEEIKAVASHLESKNELIDDMAREVASFFGYRQVNRQTRTLIESILN